MRTLFWKRNHLLQVRFSFIFNPESFYQKLLLTYGYSSGARHWLLARRTRDSAWQAGDRALRGRSGGCLRRAGEVNAIHTAPRHGGCNIHEHGVGGGKREISEGGCSPCGSREVARRAKTWAKPRASRNGSVKVGLAVRPHARGVRPRVILTTARGRLGE